MRRRRIVSAIFGVGAVLTAVGVFLCIFEMGGFLVAGPFGLAAFIAGVALLIAAIETA